MIRLALAVLLLSACSRISRDDRLPPRTVTRPAPPVVTSEWAAAHVRTLHMFNRVFCDANRYWDADATGESLVRSLDGTPPVHLGMFDPVIHVAWSADCTGLAVVTTEEKVHAWDLTTGRHLPVMEGSGFDHEEGHDTYPPQVAPHAVMVLAPWPYDGAGLPLMSPVGPLGQSIPHDSLRLSSSGRYLTDGESVWDSRSGARLCGFPAETFEHDLAADDTVLRFAEADAVTRWSLEGCRELPDFHATIPGVARHALSPDGSRLASVGDDVFVTEVASGKTVRTKVAHSSSEIAWSTDGRFFVVASTEGWLHVFDAAGQELAALHPADYFVSPEVHVAPRRIVLASFTVTYVYELP